MNPHQYCTRCGDELTDPVKQAYLAHNPSGPILCGDCIEDCMTEIVTALSPVLKAFADSRRQIAQQLVGVDDE